MVDGVKCGRKREWCMEDEGRRVWWRACMAWGLSCVGVVCICRASAESQCTYRQLSK